MTTPEPFLLEEDPFPLEDPFYTPPSAVVLAALQAGIDSARNGDIVYRNESFAQYSEDTLEHTPCRETHCNAQYADDTFPIEPAPIIGIPTVPVTVVTVMSRTSDQPAQVVVYRRGIYRVWMEYSWT